MPQETLSDFFNTGLITSVDKATGAPALPNSSLIPTAAVDFFERVILNHDNEEPIYGRDVQLPYTPPTELPAPFSRTCHIDGMSSLDSIHHACLINCVGLQMHLASLRLLRHTMGALYTESQPGRLQTQIEH